MPTRRFLVVLAVTLAVALPALCGGRGFRTQHLLEEHYQRHGRDFGDVTQEKYLHLAQQLRDAHPGKSVLEVKRPDGSGARFDRKTGAYVSYDPDGTIRTFFRPKDGERFFELKARNATLPQ